MKYQDDVVHFDYVEDCVPHFDYVEDRFADLQLLRYRLEGFEQLSLCQKT